MVTLPVLPDDSVTVLTIQVDAKTFLVPPGTFEFHGARSTTLVVVLVSGAELLSQMVHHRVAFKQQHVYKLNCM